MKDTSPSAEQRRSYRIICYDDDGRVLSSTIEKNLTQAEADELARTRGDQQDAASSIAQPC